MGNIQRAFLCTHAMSYEDTTTEQSAGKHDHAINEHQRYSRQMNDPSILQDVAATARPAPKRAASYPTSDPRRTNAQH
ncbi:hypothetical protein PInf_029543 [Phytophthora infestans]|nr:hypothetical protein PInf_029543 [Phytophthora infestans]